MYTVLRLYFQEVHRQRMPEVARAMNQICADICTGEDREPLRMSCTIAEKSSWDVHLDEIRTRLLDLIQEVNRFREFIISRELDILVEPEDWKHSTFDEYRFEQEFLQLLVRNQIQLVFSISRP